LPEGESRENRRIRSGESLAYPSRVSPNHNESAGGEPSSPDHPGPAIIDSWLAVPIATLVLPTERHWEILARLLTAGQAIGPLVSGAHLAALAIEHGATLITNDRDFARFPDLRVEYPLLDS
jgi:predicted nucleic acid-binding protein